MRPSMIVTVVQLAACCCLLILSGGGSLKFLEARRSKCPQSRDLQLDEQASHLGFLGDHSFRVPQDLAKMDAFCGQMKESIAGIQAYARECLQGLTKQVLSSLVKRGKQHQVSICQSEANKTEFIQRLSCIEGERVNELHRCIDASVARFEYIAKDVASEKKLPSLCCSYQIFYQDLDETLTRVCGKSDSKAGKFIQKFVTETLGELLRLICDDHRSLEECGASSKTKESLTRLQEITKKVKQGTLKPRNRSLIPPLLEILDATSSD